MRLLKIWYHIKASVKKNTYRLLYLGKVKFGRRTTFRNNFNIMIENNGKIEIGKDCFFNNGCSINSLQYVSIGNGTIFGENSHIYDHNHKFRNTGQNIKYQGYSISPVHIGNQCWIGTNVVILKGVKIGDNVVIGAGCVIEHDIQDNAVVTSGSKLEIKLKD